SHHPPVRAITWVSNCGRILTPASVPFLRNASGFRYFLTRCHHVAPSVRCSGHAGEPPSRARRRTNRRRPSRRYSKIETSFVSGSAESAVDFAEHDIEGPEYRRDVRQHMSARHHVDRLQMAEAG